MEELDLKEIMQVFWQKKFHIFVIVLIAIVAGGIYTLNCVTPLYRSSTTLILGRINSSGETQPVGKDNQQITQSELSINASLVSTYSQLIKSESLIKEVKNNLNTDISEADLRKSITVKRVDDTELIQITVSNINPGIASEVANEIAKVFGSKVEEIYKISNVYIIDSATPASVPYNINHLKDIMIFAFVGAVISVIYIVIYNLLDTTIKSSSDIEKLTNVKNLISIPLTKNDKSELITYEDSKSVVSEAFRTLRTNVQFSSINDKKTKTYLVTSCFQSEGKSYISSNLAITFAQAGKKVILIDSDMRRGRQSKMFNFPNEMGLSNYISNIDSDGMEINYDITRYIKETGITNLNIITSGNVPPNPSELLASPKVPELIKELKSFYDVIIFDGAPVLPITDSLILTRLLDSTILVARYNQTRKDDIVKAKSDLENVGGKIIGTCLNAVNTNSTSGDLNYYYYYGEKEEKSVKDSIKQNFKNIIYAFKKLKKLPKINKANGRKIKIIEEVQRKKPIVKDSKNNNSDVSNTNKEIDQVETKQQEELRLEEERRQAEIKRQEELRLEEERRQAEIKRQKELRFEEERKQAEIKRQEELRLEEERRQAEIKRQEELRLEEERRQAEIKRQEELRLEEERRQAEIKRQEELRLEEERRQAEIKRQEELRLEEERRQAEIKRQEELRLEEERRQEELRLEEERKQAEIKRQEELRLAEETRLEELRKKEELKRQKEEEKIRKREERKKKIQENIDLAKNKISDFNKKIEKKKGEKRIQKAEKKIKQMEKQAKQVKFKLQKAEEERDKIFGKRMFDLDDGDLEQTESNNISNHE